MTQGMLQSHNAGKPVYFADWDPLPHPSIGGARGCPIPMKENQLWLHQIGFPSDLVMTGLGLGLVFDSRRLKELGLTRKVHV